MNEKVVGGEPPLHCAVVTENRVAVKILLSHGAFVFFFFFFRFVLFCFVLFWLLFVFERFSFKFSLLILGLGSQILLIL